MPLHTLQERNGGGSTECVQRVHEVEGIARARESVDGSDRELLAWDKKGAVEARSIVEVNTHYTS